MDDHRQANRQPITIERHCAMGIISFKQLEWTEHKVQVKDISRSGVGVESDGRMEPGFVWFQDRVNGYKGGVLMWSGQEGPRYRAGIRFLPLTDEDERSLQNLPAGLSTHKPHRSPEEIIAALMNTMTRDDH
jgi:hypothetical protein